MNIKIKIFIINNFIFYLKNNNQNHVQDMSYSIIGTGVMGGNLALNIAQNNRINLHNRTMSKVTELITKNPDLKNV